MKKRLRKYITMIAAVAMCSGMVLTDVHATGIYVDEGATSTSGDNQEQTQQNQPEQKQQEQNQQEQNQPEANEQPAENKSVTGAVQSDISQKQGKVIDESLEALISGQETMQSATIKARSGELANEKAVRAAGAMADLNIATGDIVISNGSYEQNGLSGATDNTYVIEGTSFTNNITVKSGANPTITITDLKIDLKDLTISPSKAAIVVEPGASVNLILAGRTGVSQLAGSELASGICLDGTARLIVRGTGTLDIVGGAGAYAVGNNDSSGGTFGVAVDTAKVKAYSNRGDMAIRTNNLYTTVKILQGALAVGKVDQVNPQFVNVENRDARTEKYQLQLPIYYRAFATTTTQKGGEYVSYFPDKTVDAAGQVKDAKLLADGSSSYVYGLVSRLTATLSELTDQKITFTVTQDSNGGRFSSDGQEKRLVTNVGYGTIINTPEKPERTAKYTVDGWYLDREPAFSAAKWVFGSNEVVKDTILYMNWIPDGCIVEFNQNFTSDNPPPAFSCRYNDTVPLDASKVDKHGNYTLEGWYTDSAFKQKWEFADPAIPGSGDLVRKEKMTLYAKWLAPCTVTFNKNTADMVEDVPANLTNVPITTKIKDPGTGDDPKIPKRSNYIFTGWYTSSACTVKWDFNTPITSSSLNLYAGWVAAETIVTFDPGTDGNISTGEQVVVPNGERIPEPPDGTVTRKKRVEKPTEYVLDGWYTDTKYTKEWNFNEDTLSTANGKLTLYAKWHQAQCYVTLNAKDAGANPQQDVVIKNYNETLTEEELATKFTKRGYSITNWLKGSTRWDFANSVTEDIVLDAVWTVNNYDVNLHIPENPDDPGVPLFKNENDKKQSVKYDNSVKRPAYPKGATEEEWPGHTFLGWYKSQDEDAQQWKFSDVEAPAVPDLIEDHDTDLYAKWKLDDYKLTWHLQYGNNQPEIDEKIYHYGNKVEERKPERSNYIFKGWYTDPECSAENKWDFESKTIKGDTELYAKWQGEPRELVLTIKYEETQEGADDGKVVVQDPIKVFYGDTLKQEDLENEMNDETKKRPGYTLKGWYTDNAYTNKWKFNSDPNPDIIKDNPTKLYAYWTRDVYTIHFDTYEGDTVNNIEDIQSYYGYTIDEPEKPIREPHYTFGGWYTDAEKTEENKWDFAKEVTGNMTLYAKWIPNIYTLKFETNGGSKLEPIEVTYNTYPDPAALDTKKEGYVIEGWFRDADFTAPAFDPQKDLVTDNMTLYVKWKLEEYTVTFHYLESKDSDKEEIVKDETNYNVDNYVKEPVKVLEHKTLSKWYQDKGMQQRWVFKRDKIKKSMDLYAYWSDTKYKVHFETYEGTAIEDQEWEWGTLLEAPAEPERMGYTFNGWFKDAGQTNAWDFENDFVEENTTIFSGWTANMYTVTFDVNGGTGEIAAQTLPFGSMIAQPAAPTREKYKFTGWKVSGKAKATAGADWNFNNDTVDGDITLAAQWAEETSADPGGGGAGAGGSGSTGGSGATGNTNATSGTPGSGSGTGTDGTADPTSAANQAIKDAINGLSNILTGDKAPLTYSIAGAIVGVFMLAWALIRKFK